MQPSASMVCHIKQPAFPQFRFEWHPESRRVFLIRLSVEPLMGDPIALDVPDHGAAVTAVLVWLRGYREGRAESLCTAAAAPPHPSLLRGAIFPREGGREEG